MIDALQSEWTGLSIDRNQIQPLPLAPPSSATVIPAAAGITQSVAYLQPVSYHPQTSYASPSILTGAFAVQMAASVAAGFVGGAVAGGLLGVLAGMFLAAISSGGGALTGLVTVLFAVTTSLFGAMAGGSIALETHG